MSDKPKINEISLNGWGFLVLAVIIFFFWEPLLIIGGISIVGRLIYRNRTKIQSLWHEIAGKN